MTPRRRAVPSPGNLADIALREMLDEREKLGAALTDWYRRWMPAGETSMSTDETNVVSLTRTRPPSPPPLDFDADGSCRTGETRQRDRWFGIPAVEEKVIYECGKVRWRRVRPPLRPISLLCVASYLAAPLAWFALLAWLWSRL